MYRASTDCDTSDEEDDQNNNSHDSFIDDRTCPTIAATQSATSGTDMMAIYRSLVSLSGAGCHDKVQLTSSHQQYCLLFFVGF